MLPGLNLDGFVLLTCHFKINNSETASPGFGLILYSPHQVEDSNFQSLKLLNLNRNSQTFRSVLPEFAFDLVYLLQDLCQS